MSSDDETTRGDNESEPEIEAAVPNEVDNDADLLPHYLTAAANLRQALNEEVQE